MVLYVEAMRHLRQKKQNDRSKKKTDEQVQPDLQKKKISQFAMGKITFGQKSQGVHEVHQIFLKEKIIFNFKIPPERK